MPYLIKKYYPVRKVIFFLGEGLLIFATLLAVEYLFSYNARIYQLELPLTSVRAALVTLIFQLSLYFFDLYDLRKPGTTKETAVRMMQSFGVGCIALGGVYYAFPSLIISTKKFWICYMIICLALIGWRSAYYAIIEKKYFSREVILIGTGKAASQILTEVYENKDSGYTISLVVGPHMDSNLPRSYTMAPSLGEYLKTNTIDPTKRIVVALDDRRGNMPVEDLLSVKIRGTKIEDGISFYETLTGKILVEKLNPGWLIFSEGFDVTKLRYFIKRFSDLALATFGLTLTLPVSLITALLIKLESPGPVFYSQERVGEHDLPFKVHKFRSMRQDAEKNGAVWAQSNDTRVTKVGAVIRKIRVDEIPQMWNVVKGEMSFVGPRPERPVFVEQLTGSIPFYSLRHATKPGITGWAQICYPYGASEEDALRKLEYDLYYLKNQSIFLDLLIVFRTIKTVLFQKGSR